MSVALTLTAMHAQFCCPKDSAPVTQMDTSNVDKDVKEEMSNILTVNIQLQSCYVGSVMSCSVNVAIETTVIIGSSSRVCV